MSQNNDPIQALPADPLTALSHRLIRQARRDDLDPFMVGSGPGQSPAVRACFYYAVVVTPQTTVLFDNDGRGGMCDRTPHEMVAAWRTAEILASQGNSWEDLQAGRLTLSDAPLPVPMEIVNDLDPVLPWNRKAPVEDPAWSSPGFAGRVSLRELLTHDPELLLAMAHQLAPSVEDDLAHRDAAALRRLIEQSPPLAAVLRSAWGAGSAPPVDFAALVSPQRPADQNEVLGLLHDTLGPGVRHRCEREVEGKVRRLTLAVAADPHLAALLDPTPAPKPRRLGM